MAVDIVCVGFGPAMGGFLTTLSRNLVKEDGTPIAESHRGAPPAAAGHLLRVARTTSASGVSGVVHAGAQASRRVFRSSTRRRFRWPAPVRHEKIAYLLDPIGVSRRSLRVARGRPFDPRGQMGRCRSSTRSLNLPWVPPVLRKHEWPGAFHGPVHAVGRGAGHGLPAPCKCGRPRPPRVRFSKATGLPRVRLIDQGTTSRATPSTVSCRAWTSARR